MAVCSAQHVLFDGKNSVEDALRDELVSIPFLSLADELAPMMSELEEAAARVIRSGQYLFGPESLVFEDQWAQVVGRSASVGCANGLDALILALRALGIGPDDEVIVPDMTFVATALAVIHCGATPVVVDVDPGTLLLDPAMLRTAITCRTQAVIPVHLYGQMAEVETIAKIVGEDIAMIEDAAQAHLATRWDESPGKFGVLSCYSFYPGKNLGALGDGGAVVSDRPDLLEKVRELGNYGQRHKYEHTSLGMNSRLDEIQAAFLQVRLKHLPKQTNRRIQVAERYCQALANRDDIELLRVASGNKPAWHIFPVRVDNPQELAANLAKFGVRAQHHYPCTLSNTEALAGKIRMAGSTEVAQNAAQRLLSLPIGASITDEQVDCVIQRLLHELEARR